MSDGAERALRAAVYLTAQDEIVIERDFDPGAEVTIGAEGSEAGLIAPGWVGAPHLLISDSALLHLAPGMRVNMCDDEGRERIVGTFEELVASGVALPIPILHRRMTIRVRPGISVFAKYL